MSVEQILDQLETKVERIGANMREETRRELNTLIGTLRREVAALAETNAEDAETIAGYTRVSLHEAAREKRNSTLLQHSVDGLSSAVDDFEASHSSLVSAVNGLCALLSNMGI